MKICSIAIGSELLGPNKTDTNSLELSRALEAHGLRLHTKFICSDEADGLRDLFTFGLKHFDLIITIGGLGPTLDDRTRSMIAQAVEKPLEFRQKQYDLLCHKFHNRSRPMPETNNRQAWFPQGATVLPNPLGTAEGFLCEHTKTQIFSLPGPPKEFEHMLYQEVLPRLAPTNQQGTVQRKTFQIFGIPESQADGMLSDFFAPGRNPSAIFNCSPVDLELMLIATGKPAQTQKILDRDTKELTKRLGLSLISSDNKKLPEAIATKLTQRNLTISSVESVSGGRIAKLLNQQPGSSTFFTGGIVTYQKRAKEQFLGHPLESIPTVSTACSQLLACRGKANFHTDLSIACTGWAGPDAEDRDALGTVHLCLATPDGIVSNTLKLSGQRTLIQERSAWWALFLVWEWLSRHE